MATRVSQCRAGRRGLGREYSVEADIAVCALCRLHVTRRQRLFGRSSAVGDVGKWCDVVGGCELGDVMEWWSRDVVWDDGNEGGLILDHVRRRC